MIRRRLMLIAAPLGVVMVAASVAFASTTDTEHSSDAKLDDPHVERPIAASHRSATAGVRATVAAEWKAAAEREAAEAYAASLTPEVPAPSSSTGSSWVSGSSGSSASTGEAGDALACIRAHESDSAGGYQAVSSGGAYRGAYQFLQSTWDNAAGAAGRADLVGTDPALVSPADQDAVASYLYSQAGSQPWGGRC